ncbi:MAG: M24 family metallopeptidase, partial [Candidatus Izemoplasmatales bacterium]|nr:M24 family metallopeptidase [Candidatus Izemoplasmatales bacterium]
MVTIKSSREIELMREAGRIVAYAHRKAAEAIRPGITTKELDQIVEDAIRSQNAIPSFLHYDGYPA